MEKVEHELHNVVQAHQYALRSQTPIAHSKIFHSKKKKLL
jgi:hypothetical protein